MPDKNPQDTSDKFPDGARRPIPARSRENDREKWRRLPFDGPQNFRDLGGYRNQDGRTVKWGVLYRADRLSAMTDEDIAYFKRLRIRKIVDFRSDLERREAPSRTDRLDGTQTLRMEVFEGGAFIEEMWRSVFAGNLSDAADLRNMMEEANRRFVKHHNTVFEGFFRLLLEDENIPLLFHCMGGKDRTGFAAAMILSALNVPRETIMQDYLLTNSLMAPSVERRKEKLKLRLERNLPEELLNAVMKVQADYLNAGFEAIDAEYGSVADFLREGLGLGRAELEELQRRYLVAD